MLKQFPLWKSLLVLAVVAICALYAFPNIYPEQPTVQIGANSAGQSVSEEVADTIDELLASNGIEPLKKMRRDGSLIVFLEDDDAQKKAQDVLKDGLGEEYSVALNLVSDSPSWLRAIGGEPMKLGLDLRGGVHFLLEVDVDKKLKAYEESVFTGLKKTFRKVLPKGTKYESAERVEPHGFKFSFTNSDARTKARQEILSGGLGNEYVLTNTTINGNPGLLVKMSETALSKRFASTVNQNRIALANRINELGVAEPLVQQQGYNRIVVELPGVQDTAIAKRVLGRTADLEYRAVSDKRLSPSGRAPAGTELFYEKDTNRPILLKKQVIARGECVIDASAGFDQQGGSAQVSVSLDSKCGNKMLSFTSQNVGKPMAVLFKETKATSKTVVKDGVEKEIFETSEEKYVISVANIRGVFGSQFQTTGLDSIHEANELSLLLRSGALAAPMYIVEESTIGPSLGKKNIERGFMSLLVGFLVVLLFMILKYRVFGVIANLALAANVVIILAILSLLGATLTLPGIAGIVLTVGMAVDANVLIFSRIKEEWKRGIKPADAIDLGYQKAFSAIIDANITTLIIAIILLFMGAGSVKGFAITLAIGILTSMFTAITGTRVLVHLLYGNKKLNKLSIG